MFICFLLFFIFYSDNHNESEGQIGSVGSLSLSAVSLAPVFEESGSGVLRVGYLNVKRFSKVQKERK